MGEEGQGESVCVCVCVCVWMWCQRSVSNLCLELSQTGDGGLRPTIVTASFSPKLKRLLSVLLFTAHHSHHSLPKRERGKKTVLVLKSLPITWTGDLEIRRAKTAEGRCFLYTNLSPFCSMLAHRRRYQFLEPLSNTKPTKRRRHHHHHHHHLSRVRTYTHLLHPARRRERVGKQYSRTHYDPPFPLSPTTTTAPTK